MKRLMFIACSQLAVGIVGMLAAMLISDYDLKRAYAFAMVVYTVAAVWCFAFAVFGMLFDYAATQGEK